MLNGELGFMNFDILMQMKYTYKGLNFEIHLWITQYGGLINELDNKRTGISLQSKRF
jgi:hypothetical protein